MNSQPFVGILLLRRFQLFLAKQRMHLGCAVPSGGGTQFATTLLLPMNAFVGPNEFCGRGSVRPCCNRWKCVWSLTESLDITILELPRVHIRQLVGQEPAHVGFHLPQCITVLRGRQKTPQRWREQRAPGISNQSLQFRHWWWEHRLELRSSPAPD
ncbi:hypothetical protein HPB50_002127 [Hyalomma asiaticum]|uniref:Uncharacterized protein n=1 Tax=Hyalomma asiaticum TaxID=266040 RepID=A0ACB7SY92_HYAAI|nr:hypothetical protein HPB50_002127 [Hyalomma asiaticum]